MAKEHQVAVSCGIIGGELMQLSRVYFICLGNQSEGAVFVLIIMGIKGY